MTIQEAIRDLSAQLGPDRLIEHATMDCYTSFQAGGAADLLVTPASEEELAEALAALVEGGIPTLVMGNGSNLLVRDGGYRGAILRIGPALGVLQAVEGGIRAGAGALLKEAAAFALDRGLSGLEFASGIPGSVGGAVFMNAGAYDGEMRSVVESVRVLSRDGKRIDTLPVEAMEYGYRTSRLMEDGGIVLSADFRLEPKEKEAIAARMAELSARRKEKQPLDLPSAGSFFKRPPGHYAGQLIEAAGLKGRQIGGAAVSEKHAGFLVNRGGATASDILALMRAVQEAVYRTSGVRLEPEIRIVGEDPAGVDGTAGSDPYNEREDKR